jgi:hypothetical protein
VAAHPANGVRRILWIVALFASLPLCGTAWAHTLDVNTAQIALQDGRVEVTLEIDLLGLVIAANPQHADATSLAILDEFALTLAVQRSRSLLQSGSHLRLDGKAIPLTLSGFPAVGDIRFMAASASASAAANSQTHAQLVTLRFLATRPFSGVRNVDLVLPKEAGSVLMTFVQPATSLAAAGGRATFSVLGPQPSPAARPGTSAASK